MRMRIAIVLVLLLIGGAVGAWLYNSWETPIERNKRIIREGQRKLEGCSWFTAVEDLYGRITEREWPFSTEMSEEERDSVLERVGEAQKALVDMGYLVELNVAVSNQFTSIVRKRAWRAAGEIFPKERIEFCRLSSAGCCGVSSYRERTINILCLREDQARWEKLVRQADVEICPFCSPCACQDRCSWF